MPVITTSRSRAMLVPAISLVLIQAGCAAKPAIDDSPLVRAAVVTTDIRNNGFKGQFANDAVQVVSTVTDSQRIDQNMVFTGSILSRVGGKRDNSEIVRLDSELEWFLDNRKKRYYECPLGGCTTTTAYSLDMFTGEGLGGTGPDGEEEGAGSLEQQCPLKTVENRFEIIKTGQQRSINGFAAEEYQLEWVTALEDPDGNLARNRISSTTWTTAESGDVAEAVRMQRAFEQRYRSALDRPMAESYYAMLSEESVEIVSRFLLAGMSEADRATLARMVAEAEPVEGFPVSTKVQWETQGATCQTPVADEAPDESGRLDTSSFKGLLSSIGRNVVGQEVDDRVEREQQRMAMAPIFSLSSEVKSIEIGDVRESRLSVPAGYKLDNRR